MLDCFDVLKCFKHICKTDWKTGLIVYKRNNQMNLLCYMPMSNEFMMLLYILLVSSQ